LATELVDRTWQPLELVSVAALRAAELAARASLEDTTGASSTTAGLHSNGRVEGEWWRAGIAEATERLT
jgi:hypothetical protein